MLDAILFGFDASMVDPLARMMCHSETYRLMTRAVMQTAERLCGGKLLLVHEGSYSAPYVPFCGLAVVEQLCGTRTACDDPLLAYCQAVSGQALQPHQADAIQKAAALLDQLPA